MFTLVTGGAGYIGSHTVSTLMKKGHKCLVLDNLCNSYDIFFKRTIRDNFETIKFAQLDLRDTNDLNKLFSDYPVSAVIHFAALKSVPESRELPIEYYSNNISGLLSLLSVMQAHGVRRLVHSSSAAVYGDFNCDGSLTEDSTLHPESPYGKSKLFCEQILQDVASRNNMSVVCLRYFNPIGACVSSGLVEFSKKESDGLIKNLLAVAEGHKPIFRIFGSDYKTKDGTAVRDFVHVKDVAAAHLAALDFVENNTKFEVFNIGTGCGYSVKEVLSRFEAAMGIEIPTEFTGRRCGDVSFSVADIGKSRRLLGWSPRHDLTDMLRDVCDARELVRSLRREVQI
jgi:UDP-glucose 4-epimerase